MVKRLYEVAGEAFAERTNARVHRPFAMAANATKPTAIGAFGSRLATTTKFVSGQ